VWAIAEGRQAACAVDDYLRELPSRGDEPKLAAAVAR
jgi:hypothetical protein